MGPDIRLPIGLMFAIIGALLLVQGAIADPASLTRSLGYNVDLWWGAVLLPIGLGFLYFGRRATK